MGYRRIVAFALFPLLTVLSVRAADEKDADAKPQGAEEVLTSHGLHKVGAFYALPEETVMTKKYKEVEPLRKKATDAEKKAKDAEKRLEQKRQQVIMCMQKRQWLMSQLNGQRSGDPRIVNQANELSGTIELMDKSHEVEDAAKAARSAATDVTEHYVELVLQLRKGYNEAREKYEALAADEKVTQALESLNKDSATKLKLGPTTAMAMLDRNLKRLETSFVSEIIQMRKGDGDLWYVSATFNGQAACDLTVDTGSSSVLLPYATAAKLGITASETIRKSPARSPTATRSRRSSSTRR